MTTKPKYLLFPGWVRSKNDSDQHFITASQLARLHGVDIRECLVVPYGQVDRVLTGRDCSGMRSLTVSYHGVYRDPKQDGDE